MKYLKYFESIGVLIQDDLNEIHDLFKDVAEENNLSYTVGYWDPYTPFDKYTIGFLDDVPVAVSPNLYPLGIIKDVPSSNYIAIVICVDNTYKMDEYSSLDDCALHNKIVVENRIKEVYDDCIEFINRLKGIGYNASITHRTNFDPLENFYKHGYLQISISL